MELELRGANVNCVCESNGSFRVVGDTIKVDPSGTTLVISVTCDRQCQDWIFKHANHSDGKGGQSQKILLKISPELTALWRLQHRPGNPDPGF